MNSRDYKIIAIIALCLGIIGLSIAFAAMSTTLNIKSVTRYGGNEWNIHFANIDEGTVTGTASKGSVSLTSSTITISDIVLNKPGDAVTYTFDIVNAGAINAKIETINHSVPTFNGSGEEQTTDEEMIKNSFEYNLTYNDGAVINIGDELLSKTSKRVKLTISYDESASQTPKQDVIVTNIGTTIIYNEL